MLLYYKSQHQVPILNQMVSIRYVILFIMWCVSVSKRLVMLYMAMLGWLLYKNLHITVGVVIFMTELLFCSIYSYCEQLKQLSYLSLSLAIDLSNHHYKLFKALFCSYTIWNILDCGRGLLLYSTQLHFVLYEHLDQCTIYPVYHLVLYRIYWCFN